MGVEHVNQPTHTETSCYDTLRNVCWIIKMKVMNVIKHLLPKMKPGFHNQAGVSRIHHPDTKQKCSVKKLTVTVFF